MKYLTRHRWIVNVHRKKETEHKPKETWISSYLDLIIPSWLPEQAKRRKVVLQRDTRPSTKSIILSFPALSSHMLILKLFVFIAFVDSSHLGPFVSWFVALTINERLFLKSHRQTKRCFYKLPSSFYWKIDLRTEKHMSCYILRLWILPESV